MLSLESKHGLTRAILQFDSSQEIRDAANASNSGSRITNQCFKNLLFLQNLVFGARPSYICTRRVKDMYGYMQKQKKNDEEQSDYNADTYGAVITPRGLTV